VGSKGPTNLYAPLRAAPLRSTRERRAQSGSTQWAALPKGVSLRDAGPIHFATSRKSEVGVSRLDTPLALSISYRAHSLSLAAPLA
jgi:hypothetical protein